MKNLTFFLLICVLFADPPWTADVQVSQDPGTGNQNETTIGIYQDTLICGGWNDSRTGVYHVGFGRSFDGGLSWVDTLMIEPTYPEDGDPVICIDEFGVVYYFWLSFNRNTFTGDIVLTKSTDWGLTWGPMNNITQNSSSLDDKPWATIDGNNVFLTWYEFGTSYNLLFKRSTDYGVTWLSNVAVGSGGNGTVPFRGTGSNVFVGWGMQNLQFNKSTNMGQTWQGQQLIRSVNFDPPFTPYRLNNTPCFKTSQDRSIVYCAFSESGATNNQLDIYFTRSTDQGSTWMTPVKVNDNPSSDGTLQFYPWMGIDPNDVIHVEWHDTREGSIYDIAQYYAYSTDYGLTWSTNERISDVNAYTNTFIGDYSACEADANNVYALWCDCRNGSNDPDVFFSSRVNDIGVAEQKPRNKGVHNLQLTFSNPFRKGSIISYWPEDATLSLYQADGRKVDHVKTAGVYFVMLSKDNENITKKLVVIE